MGSSEDWGHFCLNHFFIESTHISRAPPMCRCSLGHRFGARQGFQESEHQSGLILGLDNEKTDCFTAAVQRKPQSACLQDTVPFSPLPFSLCEALLGSLTQPLKGKSVLSVPSAYLPSSLALRFPLSFLLLKGEVGCCFWRRIQVWVFPNLARAPGSFLLGPSGSVPRAAREHHSWRATHPSRGLGNAMWDLPASWPIVGFVSKSIRALRSHGTQMTCLWPCTRALGILWPP